MPKNGKSRRDAEQRLHLRDDVLQPGISPHPHAVDLQKRGFAVSERPVGIGAFPGLKSTACFSGPGAKQRTIAPDGAASQQTQSTSQPH
jgi:hypothetical protein